MLWEILLILVLILANGFFAAAEIAIIAARRGRLEQRADEGSRNARLALELSRNPNSFLADGADRHHAGQRVRRGLRRPADRRRLERDGSPSGRWPSLGKHAEAIGLTIFVVCFTYVSLILGELVPKRASLASGRRAGRFRRAGDAFPGDRWPGRSCG